MTNMNLRFAQVVAVWPQRRCVEIVYCDDGWRENNVPVLNWFVSSDTGAWSMHNLPRPPSELEAGGLHPNDEERTTLAMVAKVEGRSVVIGFIPHPLSQIMFTEDQQDRDLLWRHPSGTLQQIAPDGSYEFHHTGGAYVRIGFDSESGPADEHEDLTPYGANENWELPKNDPPTITIVTETFKARIRPGGDTLIESGGNLEIYYTGNGTVKLGGNATVHVAGSADVSAGGPITVQTPDNATVTAGGDVTAQAVGNARIAAGGDASVQAAGAVKVNAGGDLTAQIVGDSLISTGGDAVVRAAGTTKVGGGGPVAVASSELLVLDAKAVLVNCEAMVVTGDIIETSSLDDMMEAILGPVGDVVTEAALEAMTGLDLGDPGEMATRMRIAAELSATQAEEAATTAADAAQEQAAKAQADAEAATADTQEHARLAKESSDKAVGTGQRTGPGYS
ncbi:conserved protein of unknown function (plasmid) [Rhodovastum atsumiense]|uniref:Gp5/Type VI secretion system Vgr protein OB-fold domain-containing protein n=1 Tax=Rhodovastum atsumiense TaxID=504468 RepID=A0A5M6IVZ1_9PROT|nr:hypothetical protein [Rhodovastum atsumiense]KAA5611575.1 hypothetical protein F1189_13505 [Rhodovastum atsumiense]CAH2606342.1 conserved protein of unknown function [Rhodovastum atsumiense]